MFYRIPVNVIRVAIEIFLIENQVFPESPLPYSPLAALCPALGDEFSFRNRTGKVAFD